MKKGLLIKLRNALLSLGEIITDKAVLVYDGELAVGTEVFVEDAEGNWVDAESGEYAAEDGKIIVVENGKVAEIREPEPEEQPVEEMPEEVEQEEETPANEAEDADKDAYIAELEARVAELEAENAELIQRGISQYIVFSEKVIKKHQGLDLNLESDNIREWSASPKVNFLEYIKSIVDVKEL